MRISQEKISQIREAIRIEELIGNYIPLKKAGKNYKGKCPFHPDKNPSFFVDPEKGLYHCFGCGKSGNVFTFITEYNNLSFYEAVRLLGERVGIKIEFTEAKNENLYKANEFAAKYYHSVLLGDKGFSGREWFEQRGIKGATINEFMLGYALGESMLGRSAKSQGVNIQDLYTLGLLREGRDGFRQRLIFPIRHRSGKVLGFGTRVLDKSEPKYINSSESPVFKKGNLLYGLYEAGNEVLPTELKGKSGLGSPFHRKGNKMRGKAILVEGYMDLLTLHQAGIKNAVATLGTSMTLAQARLLRFYTGAAVIMFDGDLAGRKAAERAVDTLLEAGMDVEIFSLPADEDPDSFVRGNKTIDFEAVEDFVEFKFKECKSVAEKSELIKNFQETLRKIPDELKRELWTIEVAKKLDIRKELLLKSGLGSPSHRPVRKKTGVQKDIRSLEVELLGLVAGFPVARDFLIKSKFQVSTTGLKPLFEAALVGEKSSELMNQIEDEQLRDGFAKNNFLEIEDAEIKKMTDDYIKYIERVRARKLREDLYKKIKDGATDETLREYQSLMRF